MKRIDETTVQYVARAVDWLIINPKKLDDNSEVTKKIPAVFRIVGEFKKQDENSKLKWKLSKWRVNIDVTFGSFESVKKE